MSENHARDGTGFDVDSFIEKDKDLKRKKYAERSGDRTVREYLDIVAQDSLISMGSSARLKEILSSYGFEDATEEDEIFGVTKRSKWLDEIGMYGDPAHSGTWAIYNWLNSGPPTGQMGLVLVGPTATGKSTWVDKLMKELERYNLRPVFGIRDCPMPGPEEPLNVIPRYARRRTWDPNKAEKAGLDEPIEDKLGIGDIEGDLCPHCHIMLNEDFTDEDGVVRWWDVPVTEFSFSFQGGRGIGTFEPSDEKTQDVATLVGMEQIGVTQNPDKGFGHRDAYSLTGELEKGNRGITEAREIFKRGIDVRLLWVFINVAAEKQIKAPDSTMPNFYVDTTTIGHCNIKGLQDFVNDEGQEGLHSRFYLIPWGYPLKVKDEVKIYRDLINKKDKESKAEDLSECHIAPGALELAATFAVATRLVESSNFNMDVMTKLKAYNGERVLSEIEDDEQTPVSLRDLYEEGQQFRDDPANWDKNEGMFGLDARDILSALNIKIAEQKETANNGCLTHLGVIRALRDMFLHRGGHSSEEIERYKLLLSAEEGTSTIIAEYKEMVTNYVTKAFLGAYEDLAREIFEKYIAEVKDYVNRKSKVTQQEVQPRRDPATGKTQEPDEKFMRSVEEHVPVAEQSKDTFRGEVVQAIGLSHDFSYESYEPLRRAVERRLISETRSTLILVLDPNSPRGEEEKRRAAQLFDTLKDKGFCEICAKEVVEEAAKHLNE